jgi:putative toxin-antitoxin system antitoxin component (TIGR02293 family)
MRFVEPLALYKANPLERIEMVSAGFPVSFLSKTAKILRITPDQLCRVLCISKTSITRKKQAGKSLSLVQSERVLGILMLVGQVEAIMENSGDDSVEFDVGAWTSSWINEPLPALNHLTPQQLMDTGEGQRLVRRILSQSINAYV